MRVDGKYKKIPRIPVDSSVNFPTLIRSFAEFMEIANDNRQRLPQKAIIYYNSLFIDTPQTTTTLPLDEEQLERMKQKSRARASHPAMGMRRKHQKRMLQMNSLAAVAIKLLKNDPKMTISELQDILQLKFPDKTPNNIYAQAVKALMYFRIFTELEKQEKELTYES